MRNFLLSILISILLFYSNHAISKKKGYHKKPKKKEWVCLFFLSYVLLMRLAEQFHFLLLSFVLLFISLLDWKMMEIDDGFQILVLIIVIGQKRGIFSLTDFYFLLFFPFFWLLYQKQWMGGADLKLFASLSLLGFRINFLSWYWMALWSFPICVYLKVGRKIDGNQKIPMIPFITLGYVFTFLSDEKSIFLLKKWFE